MTPTYKTSSSSCRNGSIIEHDQELAQRRLELKASKDGDKYLHADVIVSADMCEIKLVYHNKNSSITYTHEQSVGRFLAKHDCAPRQQKLHSIASVLARAHRFTSHECDLVSLIIQVHHECSLLQYSSRDFCLIMLAATRTLAKSDPCTLYTRLASALRRTQHRL